MLVALQAYKLMSGLCNMEAKKDFFKVLITSFLFNRNVFTHPGLPREQCILLLLAMPLFIFVSFVVFDKLLPGVHH